MTPPKPTLRRFTWCRIDHELLFDSRWALVAKMAGVPRHEVEAFVLRLEIHASAARKDHGMPGFRSGEVATFNIKALAADWRVPTDKLDRIYEALEHPDIGWIDQGCIVTFWPRNPDTEIEQHRREQAKLRQRGKRARDHGTGNTLDGNEFPMSRVTPRDSRVTERESRTRSDQKDKKAAAGVESVNSGDIPKIGQETPTGPLTAKEADRWRAKHPRQHQLPLFRAIKKQEG